MNRRAQQRRRRTPTGSLLAIIGLFLVAGCSQKQPDPFLESPVVQGWAFYRLGEFGAAVEAFETARRNLPPDDPRGMMALYGLATTWNLRTPVGDQDKDLAQALYHEIIDADPDSDLAAWSLLALARMQHLVPVGQDPDYKAVHAAYEEVVERFPDHLAGHEAFIYLQATRVQTLEEGPTRQAANNLEQFVTQYPDSGFVSGAYQLLSTCYETLQNPDKQLGAEIAALETLPVDPSNPKHENSGHYWRIATIAEFEAGDFEIAQTFLSTPDRRISPGYSNLRVATGSRAHECNRTSFRGPRMRFLNGIRKYFALIVIAGVYLWSMIAIAVYRGAETEPDTIALRIGHWQLEASVREALAKMAYDYSALRRRNGLQPVRIIQDAIPEMIYGQWISTQLMGGTAPDILEVGRPSAVPHLAPYYNRYLAPLTEYVNRPIPYNAGTEIEGAPAPYLQGRHEQRVY